MKITLDLKAEAKQGELEYPVLTQMRDDPGSISLWITPTTFTWLRWEGRDCEWELRENACPLKDQLRNGSERILHGSSVTFTQD